MISTLRVEVAVRSTLRERRTRRDKNRRFTPVVGRGFGLPANVESDLPQKVIEFRAIRQRLGFGITALEPIPDLLDREACLAVTQTQP